LLIALLLPIWAPVMMGVMLWIKLASPGPVIYRQERIGLRKKRFTIYKFRSMKVCAETRLHESHLTHLIKSNAPMTKLDHVGDERLIPLGRLLRAVGLDELPQVFNVIRGEMSLVGPRPCTPHEFEHYQPCHLARVDVSPGLTGYWQVNGKNNTTFSEMIEMDIFYARNFSFALDLAILARTGAVLTNELFNTIRFRFSALAHRPGGLEAFAQLLKHLPADTGMGFALVQHAIHLNEAAEVDASLAAAAAKKKPA